MMAEPAYFEQQFALEDQILMKTYSQPQHNNDLFLSKPFPQQAWLNRLSKQSQQVIMHLHVTH